MKSMIIKWSPLVLPLLVLFGSSILTYSYFTYPGTGQSFYEEMRDFYPNIQGDWLSFSDERLAEVMDERSANRWETYVVREAMARWRVRSIAPESFDLIMNNYENGIWFSPSAEQWREEFEAADQRWIKARRAAKDADVELRAQTMALPERIGLGFGKLTTAEIGSLLQIYFEAPATTPVPEVVRVLWTTDQHSGVADERVRLVPVRFATPRKPDTQLFLYEMDMSWEPEWLKPYASNVILRLDIPQAERYKILAVIGEDSPLLTVD